MGIAKHKRNSSTHGATGTFKKDGHAKGSVPDSMVGTKPGKTPQHGYSGPPVVKGTHNS